ncbi:MAG: hypothetical protein F6J95_002100 [Leptolyngbya sp. SIO1E4]|nr:hypothetical protein [Leptolyngbya sp. SIO1E4]
MAKPSHQKTLRKNPFWAYRDPISGQWITLMPDAQGQESATQSTLTPPTQQPQTQDKLRTDSGQSDISAP